jgi:hypothetical protein
MPSLPINYNYALIFIFFQGFLIVIVAYFFIEKLINSYKMKSKEDLHKHQIYEEAVAALESAKKEASDIIKKANAQASEIINSGTLFNEDLKSDVTAKVTALLSNQEQIISKSTADIANDIRSLYTKEKINSLVTFEAMFKDLKSDLNTEVTNYSNVLNKSSQVILEDMRHKLLNDEEVMAKNLQEYEKEVKEHIKSKSLDSVMLLTRRYFEQTVTKDEHEGIVRKIIENEGLKDKFFPE